MNRNRKIGAAEVMISSGKHSILVTIHDQDLLLTFEKDKKFEAQKAPLIYMFVGKGPVDKLRHLDNVIVARELEDNIEDYKYLVDFTAWYACINNSIPLGEFVSLIQYDVAIKPEFSNRSSSLLTAHPNAVLGYSPEKMKDRNFVKDNMGYRPLLDACKIVYSIDIERILNTNMRWSQDKYWPATNNVAMHREALKEFVRWFYPLAKHIGNRKAVGHSFERAIKLFCILTGRENIYAPDLLSHFQLNSHGSQDFSKDTSRLHELLARNISSPKLF